MHHRFRAYDKYKGDELIPKPNGSLISLDQGMATGYAIDRLQDRGRFYIDPGEQVYRGQVIGESTRLRRYRSKHYKREETYKYESLRL